MQGGDRAVCQAPARGLVICLRLGVPHPAPCLAQEALLHPAHSAAMSVTPSVIMSRPAQRAVCQHMQHGGTSSHQRYKTA